MMFSYITSLQKSPSFSSKKTIMAVFQKAVVKRYIKTLDKIKVQQAWAVFSLHFHNKDIQENIRNAKEEQYQGEFLIDLFVKVLGYTKNPNPNFNLTTELKNLKGSKKADGAILKNEEATAVIELKGTETTDLTKVEPQAFGYKNNQKNCEYVIISNFEKLRFYIENTLDFLEFNLFELKREDFNLLYLCLAKDNLLNGLPKKIKEDSLAEEVNITKNLYNDYSLFRTELFNDILLKNPKQDKLMLFKKTQKLLDRFLFIFFAEDKLLLPANSIRLIITEWKELNFRFQRPETLYQRFVAHFQWLDSGKKDDYHDIFAYNGGLFQNDEIINNLLIDDDILLRHTLKLSDYDFASEVSVNILGHIFEHSLNEIEEIQAELAGEKPKAKNQTKRKKDGVFYTPKYITEYIVGNTVGKLCEEKKASLQIVKADFEQERKDINAKTLKALLQKLETYRTWLLQLTICDPACGSGAFLNEALEFLIAEHDYIDKLESKLIETETETETEENEKMMEWRNVENMILTNNLFGVDINDESIQIAKLSLWLRTAQKGRKLVALNDNIKCGNSLIDDAEVAGDKAFVWENEFPKVFEKGGFDVVIGNPPYGAKLSHEVQKYLVKRYMKGASETAISFITLSHEKLLKNSGQFGFIIPKSFSFASNYAAIRTFIKEDIREIIDCKKVWREVKLEQIIFFFQKNKTHTRYLNKKLENEKYIDVGLIDKKHCDNFGFYLNDISNEELLIALKMRKSNLFIKDIATNARGGMFQKQLSEKGNMEVLGGAEIQRHGIVGVKGKINKEVIENDSKAFINENSVLVQRIIAHIQNPIDHIKITACYPKNRNYAIVDTLNQITFEKKYNAKVFWFLFNSKLINWYCYRFIFAKAIRTMQFDNPITNRLPIPEKLNQAFFIEKADKMLLLNEQMQAKITRFQKRLRSNFDIEKMSNKLVSFYDYDFKTFLEELKKQKITLKLAAQDEWEEYFDTYKTAINALQSEIAATDSQIDEMVYELYGLTEEEIAIVEAASV